LLAAGVGCGVLIALSVPPFGFWPLAWVGFAGLALLIFQLPFRGRVVAGAGAGLGLFVPGLWWVQEFSVPGCIALMLLSALFVTVAVALVPSSRLRGLVIGMPALFVMSEWVRDRFPLDGFPLGSPALGQAISPLAPTLRLGGSLLLIGETVLVGVAIAAAVLVLSDLKARPADTAYLAVAALVAVAVLIPVAGVLSPSGRGGHLPPVSIGLVQGGGPRGTRAINTDPQVVFDRHRSASASLEPPLDLVVWPEGILQSGSLDYRTTNDAAYLASLAQSLHATVVAGVEQDVGTSHYLNQVVAWSPSGQIVATYVKNHLVPFGEYVPWRSFLERFFNLSEVPLDAIPGHSPAFMNTPAAPLGVMISYEVFFDERARSGVRAGGQILIVPTNTASYRSSQVPTQELAAARERAQETGRWVLQVTPTGYTAVVEPSGRVLKRTTLGRQQVLEAVVSRETGRTVYVTLGDLPVFLLSIAAFVLALLLVPRRSSRR
jgi:apolipoprotein N-acyltransferase